MIKSSNTHLGIERRRRTPQSHLYWVSGCPPQRQGTIAAPRGPGESGSQQASAFHFHPIWMAGTGAGARRPWLGGRIAASTKLELAQRRRVLRNLRRNGGGGRSDRVLDPIPFLRWKQSGARNGSRVSSLIYGPTDKFTLMVKMQFLDFWVI
jgi:hypothetical protein